VKLQERVNGKLALLKEMMATYLVSHGDAYRKFDASHIGKMSFLDF
jgi:hypothetical protein